MFLEYIHVIRNKILRFIPQCQTRADLQDDRQLPILRCPHIIAKMASPNVRTLPESEKGTIKKLSSLSHRSLSNTQCTNLIRMRTFFIKKSRLVLND
ncbi:unnamed protein product [Phytomonas sp. Hart1]|nr:unnamed protein product [Phytomonas sp. Hart1]|eukprot:CCW72239.1 unnamed protein product [Phytomonas sp. isolate Hart1]